MILRKAQPRPVSAPSGHPPEEKKLSARRTAAATALTALALGAGSLGLAGTTAQAAPLATPAAPVSTVLPAASRATLHIGMQGPAVRKLQAALASRGYSQPQTGYFGSITRGNVTSFQNSRGLVASGRADAATRRALGLSSSVTSSTTSTQVASRSAASTAVSFAYAQIGKPYVWGATGPASFDCSGLTSQAWAAAGVSIPRTSQAQWSGLRSVSTANLQPGDLVIFYGGSHVGIYVGNGYVIHAPRPGKTVAKVPLSYMPVSGAVRPA